MLAPDPSLAPTRPAPPSARIRRAIVSDLDDLVELENATFAIERISARQLRRHLQSSSALVLVALRDRRIIGSAVLFFRRANHIARLYSIAVAASERGGGIGESLLIAGERAAKARGSRSLRLEVRADNAGAHRLYERLGYHRFGSRPGYYEDGHDALRYEKALA